MSYEEFLGQIIGSALKRTEQAYPHDTKSAKVAIPGMTGKSRWLSYSLRTQSDMMALLNLNGNLFVKRIIDAKFCGKCRRIEDRYKRTMLYQIISL